MMDKDKYIVGLDIGTTKIVAMVGRLNEHGKVEVLGTGKAKSMGVQRGVVSNISLTIESIKTAVQEAEQRAGVKIEEVVVGIAGQHIRSLQHSDYIIRTSSEEVIGERDIQQLEENVNKLVMLPGEQIIHVLPQEYKIDGQSEIPEPRGMYGGRLEANFHIVVGQITAIRNLWRCATDAGLKVKDITLEPIASAAAVLSEEEKEAGVVLVDIGGGTTDVAIFKDGIIRHTAVIPFGGNMITLDIKEGCSIIEKQAEQLKVKFGSAWPGENKDNEIVSIPGLRGRDPKEISLKNLSKIINARVTEIINQVHLEIKNYGYEDKKRKIIAGIVLTGGGAQLKHIKQLVEYITGLDTRIGYPNEHMAKSDNPELSSPIYATSVGLVMIGYDKMERLRRMEEEPTTAEPELKEGSLADTIEISDEMPAAEIADQAPEPEVVERKRKERKSYFDKWVENFTKFLSNEE